MQKIKRAPITLNKIDNFWNVGAYRCSIGKVDTWDIELTKYVRNNNLKCLVAPINMVSNIGFDKHATNTTIQDFPLGLPTSEITLSNINFDQIMHNKNFDNALERLVFHIKFRHKFLSLLSFVFDRKIFLKNIKNSNLSERLKLITLP